MLISFCRKCIGWHLKSSFNYSGLLYSQELGLELDDIGGSENRLVPLHPRAVAMLKL